jgi:two-component system NarL family response regulator
MRTLIVDDDARFRRFVKGILSNEPDIVVVGEAADGQEAIIKAKELKPDLVLMDVRMHKLNGLQATRQLKEEMPELKIIILTLYDFEEYREAATAAGVVDYILKKSINGELIPAIRKAFE